MVRIFLTTAALAVLLLAANFVVGLLGGDFNAAARAKHEAHVGLIDAERQVKVGKAAPEKLDLARQQAQKADQEFTQPRSRMTLHMLLGATAALATVLVSSITITYFVGTSRWCKEVCETYQLDPRLAEAGAVLKRSTFPWALAGSFAIIIVVGLGAAADPSGANWSRSAQFVLPHYLGAMVAIVIVLLSFWVQFTRIAENASVIQRILSEVDRVRTEKGLEVASVAK